MSPSCIARSMKRRHTTRQVRQFSGQHRIRGRLETTRCTVPPATELAPDVTDDELGLVVEGPEAGLGQDVVGHVHAAHDRVEHLACVHHFDDLGDETFECRSNVGEHRLDAIATLDRQAVRRQEQFRTTLGHRSKGRCPFDRISLNLLWIAGVGEVPDDEVAGEEPLALGDPAPQVIVGLNASVVEFDGVIPDGQRVVIVDDMIRAQRRCRNELGPSAHCEITTYPAELAGVDPHVPFVRGGSRRHGRRGRGCIRGERRASWSSPG